MINKLDLVANIERYYLNGTVESVKWNIASNKLNIDFVSPNQDLVGHVECDVKLEDGTIGIFNTSGLLKMLSILDMDVLINVEKTHKVPTKLQIEDSNFSLQYSLADPFIIQSTPSISEPEYEISFIVDSEFIMRFAKAKGALGSNVKDIFRMSTITNDEGNKQVKFVLGEPTSHSNKVEFTTEASFENLHDGFVSFNSAYVKEILNANKNDMTEAKGYLSVKGLLKLEFTNETGTSVYYLPELQIL
jgi:hypothetical protein